jgi:hypothetical protein
MRSAIVILAAGLLAGCVSVAARQGVEGPVTLGQVAYVSGPLVRPDRVIEDSRCPVDVQCVWAGRVVVRATVIAAGGSREIDLTLGVPAPVADGALTLVAVEPARVVAGPAQPQPLRFTFAFQGGL